MELRKRGIKITSEPRSASEQRAQVLRGGEDTARKTADPFIANEQDNSKNRFDKPVYWVDYTLAPLNEQTEKVKKELKQLKDSIGGIQHACNR